jgi:hypothetical protein
MHIFKYRKNVIKQIASKLRACMFEAAHCKFTHAEVIFIAKYAMNNNSVSVCLYPYHVIIVVAFGELNSVFEASK